MVIISIPRRLQISSSAILLCIPLMVLEVAIVSRAPTWNLPYRAMSTWALICTLICVPLSSWLAAAKKWAWNVAAVISSVWVLVSMWVALSMMYPTLAFFSVFLFAYLLVILFWVRVELQRSFIDPQLTWYQGFPKAISELKCQIKRDDKVLDCKVSRIDQDGLFLFSAKNPSFFFVKQKFTILLKFKNQEISCEGMPVVASSDGMASGVKFLNLNSDIQKEMGDFVETLRGHGYA